MVQKIDEGFASLSILLAGTLAAHFAVSAVTNHSDPFLGGSGLDAGFARLPSNAE